MLRALWAYRGFVLSSVKREFQLKYQNSLLGAAWSVINPLAMILVYTVIFGEVMKNRLPEIDGKYSFSIYLCAGVLTWSLFSEIVNRSLNIFTENANLLKKVNFPRLTLPVIVVISSTINFLIIFSLFIFFLIFIGEFPGAKIIALLPMLLLEILFSISLGVILGIMNVFYRDVGQAIGVIIQFWFWLTPIVYTQSVLPLAVKEILWINPLVPLITSYQNLFVLGDWPKWSSFLPLITATMILSFLAFKMFRNQSAEMIDEL